MSPVRNIAIALFIVTLPLITKPFSCAEADTKTPENQTPESIDSELNQILEDLGYKSIFDEPCQTPDEYIAAGKDNPIYHLIGQPIEERRVSAIRNGTIPPLKPGDVLKKNSLVITVTHKGKLVYARVLNTMPTLPTIFHIVEIEHGVFVKQLCRYLYRKRR